jgi:uncharacterized YigZ family protein
LQKTIEFSVINSKQFNFKNVSKFKTVKKVGEGLYKEKGSKFLGFAFPCSSEEEAKNKLIQLRKDHHLAVHVCYAFRFGSDKKQFRASDDGEPSNSAGPPILGQIQSFDLTNILVAVVRYYGGTNLGVGGLINAYRTAAKEAIENTGIIEDEDFTEIEVRFKYEQLPQVMKLIKSYNVKILEQSFDSTCVLKLSFPVSNQVFLIQLTGIEGVKLT